MQFLLNKTKQQTATANTPTIRKQMLFFMLMLRNSKRYTKYRYKVPGFSILPYLGYQYTRADYNNLEKALKILENNLPTDVFEHVEFALRSRIEYDYGNKEKSIDYGENFRLRGRERLPLLYKSINKTVLSITYKTYNELSETYLLHPYLLKQYNNRWFLFGYRPDVDYNYWCVPLDRIENVELKNDLAIISRPEGYNSFFDDIIGVTKGSLRADGTLNNIDPSTETIVLDITDWGAWKRITTKPIHKSQQVLSDFVDGHGRLQIKVMPNKEFYYSLIAMGYGISIISPATVSEIMDSILCLYKKR